MRSPVLIFDFGNVIAHFDYARACEPLAARLGTTGTELLVRLRSRGLTPLVVRYERGALTDREFARAVGRLIPGLGDVTFDQFAACWRDIFWLNEPVVRLAAGLKQNGYRLILGSNTNALHADDFRVRFAEALAPFDRLVLSYQVGHAKPTAGFYLACAAAAEAPPGDCVFIDDVPENVAGARAVGMTGLVYRDPATLRADLARLGISPSDPG
jgi:putative hydrolase of the HAD superfamily